MRNGSQNTKFLGATFFEIKDLLKIYLCVFVFVINCLHKLVNLRIKPLKVIKKTLLYLLYIAHKNISVNK